MKTSLTSMAILAFSLGAAAVSPLSMASLLNEDTNTNRQTLEANEVSLEEQIKHSILSMLSHAPKQVEKNQINQQLAEESLAMQTTDLIKELESNIPKMKFKVILAD
ncbi:hypothetical protein [Paraglaciecola aestuariivivens]